MTPGQDAMVRDDDFQRHASAAFQDLHDSLMSASEDYDFAVTRDGSKLVVESKHPPARCVVEVHPAFSQIWIATASKTIKLDWDIVENAFLLTRTGETLREVIEQALSAQLRQEVVL